MKANLDKSLLFMISDLGNAFEEQVEKKENSEEQEKNEGGRGSWHQGHTEEKKCVLLLNVICT